MCNRYFSSTKNDKIVRRIIVHLHKMSKIIVSVTYKLVRRSFDDFKMYAERIIVCEIDIKAVIFKHIRIGKW